MTTDDAGGTQNNALQIDTPSQRSDHIHIVIGTRKPLDLEMTALKFDACKINTRLVRIPAMQQKPLLNKDPGDACKDALTVREN